MEEGTFEDVIGFGGAFKHLMDEFGGSAAAKSEDDAAEEEEAIEVNTLQDEPEKTIEQKIEKVAKRRKAAGTGKLEVSGTRIWTLTPRDVS